MANPPVRLVKAESPSRFEIARLEAQERATIELAANLVKTSGEKLARAHALLNTAAGSDPAPRQTAMIEARKSLRGAFAELAEVMREMGE